MKKSKIIKKIQEYTKDGINNLNIVVTDPNDITSNFDFPYEYIVSQLYEDECLLTVIDGNGDDIVEEMPIMLYKFRKSQLRLLLTQLSQMPVTCVVIATVQLTVDVTLASAQSKDVNNEIFEEAKNVIQQTLQNNKIVEQMEITSTHIQT